MSCEHGVLEECVCSGFTQPAAQQHTVFSLTLPCEWDWGGKWGENVKVCGLRLRQFNRPGKQKMVTVVMVQNR